MYKCTKLGNRGRFLHITDDIFMIHLDKWTIETEL